MRLFYVQIVLAKMLVVDHSGVVDGRRAQPNMEKKMKAKDMLVLAGLAGVFLALIAFAMWVLPQYSVYKQRLEGEAILAHANSSREVQVRQAQGEKEAATLRSEAIKIVGQATKDFPEYRQQEFIGAFAEAVKDHNISQIIYVPTEANIPITESRRVAK